MTFKQHNCQVITYNFQSKFCLSYQKIPETAYKLSEGLENGNREIMQEEEGYNRKENLMMMMMTTMTNGDDNDNDNDDRCLQCVTVSECK